MSHGHDDVVVAVDGGGSKTDVVVLGRDGTVLATAHGPGSSPQLAGLDTAVTVIDDLIDRAVAGRTVAHAGLYMSGLDLPIETERLHAAIADRPWAARGLSVDNDLFALLRAGTDDADAIAVVCGTGINALGVRADGRTARFAALGDISGDWGGGYGIGAAALWHAARAEDGRGPATALVDGITERLGVGSISILIEQLHLGDRDHTDLALLSPVVFDMADVDPIAQALIDRQATEIVDFVRAIAARLEFGDTEFAVVLGGGILRAERPRLDRLVAEQISRIAPRARLEIVRAAPVVGAALLGLQAVGADAAAARRARISLS